MAWIAAFLFAFNLVKAQDDTTVAAPPVDMIDSVYETSSTRTDYQFNPVSDSSRFQARAIPAPELNKVRSDEDYWYVNEVPPREKKKPSKPETSVSLLDRPWFQTLFWFVLVGGFVALLVWFLATGNISLFRKKPQRAENVLEGEEEPEDIFSLDFDREIRRAVDAGEHRRAVRLLYLQTLKRLSQHGLIDYTREKTNRDYLLQLSGSPYYKPFFSLTRDFDYTWYGQFPVSRDQYSVIEDQFTHFKEQLSQ